eukprot:scaffold2996_cov122-Skeletonema_marinoi.AAC.4
MSVKTPRPQLRQTLCFKLFMTASPPHTSVVGFGLDLLQAVKHSPITRSNQSDDAVIVSSNENASRNQPSPNVRYLSPKAFLLQSIEQKPDYYSSSGESIDNLLAADLVKTPVSFDSTLTASEEESELPPVEEKVDGRNYRASALPPNNNHYHFYYPQPSPSCSLNNATQAEHQFNNAAEPNQGHWLQYPFVSLPEPTTQLEAKEKPATNSESVVETNTLEAGHSNLKRDREETLAPIPEKASFAANPRSPPAPVAAAFATLPVAIEAMQQSSPLVDPSHGLSISTSGGFTGLQLLSNVSSSSSQWGSLTAATASEAANTNAFSYHTIGSISAKESKSKIEGCRCQQSKCLKLYCACFRDGKICMDDCKCLSCANTEAESGTDGKVTVARQEVLTKKPNAFGDKTCKCKKSKCLKMYCACFSSGNACGDKCKCEDCANPKGQRTLPIRPTTEEALSLGSTTLSG